MNHTHLIAVCINRAESDESFVVPVEKDHVSLFALYLICDLSLDE